MLRFCLGVARTERVRNEDARGTDDSLWLESVPVVLRREAGSTLETPPPPPPAHHTLTPTLEDEFLLWIWSSGPDESSSS